MARIGKQPASEKELKRVEPLFITLTNQRVIKEALRKMLSGFSVAGLELLSKRTSVRVGVLFFLALGKSIDIDEGDVYSICQEIGLDISKLIGS